MRPSECPRCARSRMLMTVVYLRHPTENTSTRSIEYTCADCRLTYLEESDSWRDENDEPWEPPR